jgi:hypothetical protein
MPILVGIEMWFDARKGSGPPESRRKARRTQYLQWTYLARVAGQQIKHQNQKQQQRDQRQQSVGFFFEHGSFPSIKKSVNYGFRQK